MTQTLRTFLALLVRDPETADRDSHVHFHRGPAGHPAACHDPHCPNPRLDLP